MRSQMSIGFSVQCQRSSAAQPGSPVAVGALPGMDSFPLLHLSGLSLTVVCHRIHLSSLFSVGAC